MGASAEPSSSELPSLPSSSARDLEEFEEKVKRCLLLDDLTPHVNVPMIQTALGQFGTVLSVEVLSNPLDSRFAAKRAIVEMKNAREAAHAVKEIQEHPFMIKGVPRPVRAMAAVATLFAERPRKPSKSKPACKWVEPGDSEWPLVYELKQLAKKHATEASYLTQELRKQEERLAQEQEEKVKDNIKKLDEIISCIKDNTIHRLSRYYGVRYDGGGL